MKLSTEIQNYLTGRVKAYNVTSGMNLESEQLKAWAKKQGQAQSEIIKGFLRDGIKQGIAPYAA